MQVISLLCYKTYNAYEGAKVILKVKNHVYLLILFNILAPGSRFVSAFPVRIRVQESYTVRIRIRITGLLAPFPSSVIFTYTMETKRYTDKR
jgi:hypothetical protein